MSAKPKRRARNIRFYQAVGWNVSGLALVEQTRVALLPGTRDLRGAVGEQLKAMGGEGTITFLDKPPRQTSGHLFVLGLGIGVLTSGVLVVLFAENGHTVYSERIGMCDTYRAKIVGGIGASRWAKVKVGA